MIPDYRHAVVSGEDERGLVIFVEVGEELLDLVHNLVDDLYVCQVFLPGPAVSAIRQYQGDIFTAECGR